MPAPYPGKGIGTVDGIANIVNMNYKELDGNNVISFARQGGVYKDDNGNIVYENEFKDFSDPKVRAEYNFPPRGIKDLFELGLKNGYYHINSQFILKHLTQVIQFLKGKRSYC